MSEVQHPPEPPASRVSELPEWPHTFTEPELPHVQIQQVGPARWQVTLRFGDERTARWVAHWMSRRPSGRISFWGTFGEWLDSRR